MTDYAEKVKSVYAAEGFPGLVRRTRGKIKWFLKGKRYSLKEVYDADFFVDNLFDSGPMARWLAPRISQAWNLRTVVDFGCATGHWVASLVQAGVDAHGIEGSPWVKDKLICAPERVTFADLRKPLKMVPKDNVDMCMSIEVAEHIEPQDADQFVENLVRPHPRRIMMTAAIPGQGGHGHVNEQPPSYWIEKLERHGYRIDTEAKTVIDNLCSEARSLRNVADIYRRSDMKAEGVWIPAWMPKNLMVFHRN